MEFFLWPTQEGCRAVLSVFSEDLFVSAELLLGGGHFVGPVLGKSRLYFYCYLVDSAQRILTGIGDGVAYPWRSVSAGG